MNIVDPEDAEGKDYAIEKFIGHPNYNANKVHHDIALLKLNEIVK